MAQVTEFEALRPRLMMLLEMHRAAGTEDERSALADLLQDVFLSTAWHIAEDLLRNGWRPGLVTAPSPKPAAAPAAVRAGSHLKVVGGLDAA